MSSPDFLRAQLSVMPVLAILRGLEPRYARATGQALFDAGVRLMEVPLNVPGAAESIATLVSLFGNRALVGGGTVLSEADLALIVSLGGKLVVSPHFDADLVRAARDKGLVTVPGVCTPTEAFAALKAGASGLKLFPAEALAPRVLAAWRAVLPKGEALLIPTGGINVENAGTWWAAGADGFGVGSAVFDPSGDLVVTQQRVHDFVSALQRMRDAQISV